MKSIFQLNALISLGYTAFFIIISLFLDRMGRFIELGFIYGFIACIHFMIMGVLMAVNHFKSVNDKRNGYMASFAFIWVLFLTVQIVTFYF